MAKKTEQEIALKYNDPTREFVSIADYLKNDNSYVIPYKEGITTTENPPFNEAVAITEKYTDTCFHVAMMIENAAVKAELIDRTRFTDEEMKGKLIAIDAFFFNKRSVPEMNGVNVNVMSEDENISEIAHFTDEEKVAFFEKVIEKVPESREFVERSLNSVLDRMEQEKQTNKPVDVER